MIAIVLAAVLFNAAHHHPQPPPDTANRAFAPLHAKQAAHKKAEKHDKYSHPPKK